MDNETISYSKVCSLTFEDNLNINETSLDLVKNTTILKDKVDENYKFVNKNIFFRIFSFIFYCLVYIIVYPILFFYFLPKVKGRKNLKKVKNAVFVCNHTFILDCAVLDIFALPFIRPYILAEKNSFQIPVVNFIIKMLRAVPIPNNIKAYKSFFTQINQELQNKKSLLIYPEGSLWPYFSQIRPFKNGAFKFSVKNDVPVIPLVISFRKPNKLYKFLGRKKPLININILEPIFVDKTNKIKEEENRLNNIAYSSMKECFIKNNSYVYINQKRLNKENKKLDKIR